MEVTGSVGSVLLELFNRTLCWHLAHSGISDVEVLVKNLLKLGTFVGPDAGSLERFSRGYSTTPPPPYIFSDLEEALSFTVVYVRRSHHRIDLSR